MSDQRSTTIFRLFLPSFWRERRARARDLLRTDPGEFWQRCLFWTFWFHLAFFAVGYGFREVLPLVSLVCLVQYYRHAWERSVLRRLPVLPLFVCLWIMMIIGVVFSMDPWESFLETGTAVNKGLILPFLGMECVRSLKDLKRLTWGAVLAFFWVGIDGLWQYRTGFDFVMGYPIHNGRLTSALADYCVGNYLAQIAVPAAGVWYICRRRLSVPVSAVCCALLAFPGLFTLFGARTRAALLALVVCAFVWAAARQMRHWRKVMGAGAGVVVLGFLVLQLFPGRLSMGTVLQDGRWSLWELAWRVFEAHPLTGAGAGMYNTAFRSLGLVPARDAITISHPHNLYLDLLSSFGVIGAFLGLIFLFGMLFWLGKHLIPRLRRGWQAPGGDAEVPGRSRLWWELTGLYALGYLCWLADGIFAHEFYRMWWLGQAMLGLGVATGGVCRGLAGEKESG